MRHERCATTGRLVTVEEAARLLGTTTTRVLLMLKRREIDGFRSKGEWFIHSNSLESVESPSTLPVATHPGCGGCTECTDGGST